MAAEPARQLHRQLQALGGSAEAAAAAATAAAAPNLRSPRPLLHHVCSGQQNPACRYEPRLSEFQSPEGRLLQAACRARALPAPARLADGHEWLEQITR